MIYIYPNPTPINNREIIEFNKNNLQEFNKYTNFLNTMLTKGYEKKDIDEMYINNYGKTIEPVRKIYQCYIVMPSLKITLYVTRSTATKRKYEVMTNSYMYIESLDVTRKINKVYNNNKFKIVLDKLIDEVEPGGYFINEEDRPWLTSFSVDKLLSQLSLKIAENEDVYLSSYNSIEAYNFEFTNDTFKEELYNAINDKFIQIESKLL